MITYVLKHRHQSVVDMVGHAVTLGTDVEVWRGLSTVLRARLSPFERGCLAAAALDAADVEEVYAIVETVMTKRLAGAPLPAWLDIEGEARGWADLASLPELRAYLAACFQRLPEKERAAFLSAANRRDAA